MRVIITRQQIVAAIVASLVCAGFAELTFARPVVEQIAMTGQTPPGVDDGAVYSWFKSPTINSNGDIAFTATLQLPNGDYTTAVFGPTNGLSSPLGMIAREGDDLAGSGSESLSLRSTVPRLFLSDRGDIVFQGGTNGDLGYRPALFGLISGPESQLERIVGAGDAVASLSTGTTIGNPENAPIVPWFSADSRLAYIAPIQYPNGSISTAIFAPFEIDNPTTGLVAELADVSALLNACEYPSCNFGGLSVNQSGTAIFGVSYIGDDGKRRNSLFAREGSTGSTLQLIAGDGMALPDLTDGALFETVGFRGTSPVFDDPVVFQARLRQGDGPTAGVVDSTNRAAWCQVLGDENLELELVVRVGSTPSWLGFETQVVDWVGSLDMNANSQMTAALSLESSDGVIRHVLVGPTSSEDSEIGVIAHSRQPVPGIEASAIMNGFEHVVINPAGDIAVMTRNARTRPDADDRNPHSFAEVSLLTTVDSELRLIAAAGDLVRVARPDGSGADLKLVSSISVGQFTNAGDEVIFNASGEIVYRLFFTDGTNGVFKANTRAFAPNLSGDFNGDGVVDAADYTVWRDHFDENTRMPNEVVSPGVVALDDWREWTEQFGSVAADPAATPEPTAGAVAVALICVEVIRRRRRPPPSVEQAARYGLRM